MIRGTGDVNEGLSPGASREMQEYLLELLEL